MCLKHNYAHIIPSTKNVQQFFFAPKLKYLFSAWHLRLPTRMFLLLLSSLISLFSASKFLSSSLAKVRGFHLRALFSCFSPWLPQFFVSLSTHSQYHCNSKCSINPFFLSQGRNLAIKEQPLMCCSILLGTISACYSLTQGKWRFISPFYRWEYWRLRTIT